MSEHFLRPFFILGVYKDYSERFVDWEKTRVDFECRFKRRDCFSLSVFVVTEGFADRRVRLSVVWIDLECFSARCDCFVDSKN